MGEFADLARKVLKDPNYGWLLTNTPRVLKEKTIPEVTAHLDGIIKEIDWESLGNAKNEEKFEELKRFCKLLRDALILPQDNLALLLDLAEITELALAANTKYQLGASFIKVSTANQSMSPVNGASYFDYLRSLFNQSFITKEQYIAALTTLPSQIAALKPISFMYAINAELSKAGGAVLPVGIIFVFQKTDALFVDLKAPEDQRHPQTLLAQALEMPKKQENIDTIERLLQAVIKKCGAKPELNKFCQEASSELTYARETVLAQQLQAANRSWREGENYINALLSYHQAFVLANKLNVNLDARYAEALVMLLQAKKENKAVTARILGDQLLPQVLIVVFATRVLLGQFSDAVQKFAIQSLNENGFELDQAKKYSLNSAKQQPYINAIVFMLMILVGTGESLASKIDFKEGFFKNCGELKEYSVKQAVKELVDWKTLLEVIRVICCLDILPVVEAKKLLDGVRDALENASQKVELSKIAVPYSCSKNVLEEKISQLSSGSMKLLTRSNVLNVSASNTVEAMPVPGDLGNTKGFHYGAD